MFRFDTYHMFNYFGLGAELSVQYDWVDDKKLEKKPTGVAFIVRIITREFRLGFFWGN